MNLFPQLETDRLFLRSLVAEDAAAVQAVYGDPQVTQYSEMATIINSPQAEVVIGRFQMDYTRGTGIRWAIVEKSSTRVIGTCGLGWHRPNFSGIISYDLAREFWSRGFATEALRAVIAHCFTTTDTNRISATTVRDNAASMRVLQKLGFQEEGILRDWGFWKGAFVDLRCFSLLRKETNYKSS